MGFYKGVAQVVRIICYDSETPTDPDTPVAFICVDDEDEFTETTNSPVVVESGLVTLALTASEMDCDGLTIKIESENLEDQIVSYYPEADWTASRAAHLNAAISSRSTFDPTTTLVRAVDQDGNAFASEDDVRDAILSDSTPFDGADIATIASDVSGLDGDVMRGTDSAALASDWTSTRAGYVDKLNVAGTLANTSNASTFKADVSNLALETTLSAIKGAGWSNETLKAISAAIGAISPGDATSANQTTILGHLADIKGVTWSDETLVALKGVIDTVLTDLGDVAPAGEYDTEMAHLDADISSRSSHAANDVRDAILDADLSDYEDTAATGTTLADLIVSSRAGIIGRMKIVGTTITFFKTDGITPIFTATLDDATTPTERGTPAEIE